MKLIIIVFIILIIRSKWKSPTTVQGLELTQEETHPFDLSIPFRFDKYQHCHHHPHKEHQHHHHRSQTENANIYQVDKAVVPRKIWTLSENEFLIKNWLPKNVKISQVDEAVVPRQSRKNSRVVGEYLVYITLNDNLWISYQICISFQINRTLYLPKNHILCTPLQQLKIKPSKEACTRI